MKTTNRKNKLLSTLLAFSLIFSLCANSNGALALEIVQKNSETISYPVLYNSVVSGTDILDKSSDPTGLRVYLIKQFASYKNGFDISAFKIPDTEENKQALRNYIWYDMPEAFQVYGLGISGNQYISTITVTYLWSAREYSKMNSEMQNAASILLNGVENNDSLTDVEKALLLHDRLAVWTEYDYSNYLSGSIPEESYTAYGALVKKASVCSGYTKAYIYLLNRVGIKSFYCSSDKLNHAWNIVYINGIPYHVDVTFDDKVWDVTGQVYHENFLVSSKLFYSQNHQANDYNTDPHDSRFDNSYWRNSQTEIQLIGNTLYYIDNSSAKLNKISKGTETELVSVNDKWRAGSSSTWIGNYSKLSSDGNNLLLSLSDAIYEYSISDNTLNTIYLPDLSVGSYFSIYGFTYSDGYLICDLYNSPQFSSDTKKLYQVRSLYNNQVPTGKIKTTNNLASSQTVNLNFNDNVGIAGYYWGTNSNYSSNNYTSTSSLTASKTISSPGTYYLTVKNKNGKVSSNYSITFYKTTLNANGGSVSPTYVLTKSGNTFTLPTPKKGGYSYLGWSTKNSATTAEFKSGASYKPTKSTTLYTVWKSNGTSTDKARIYGVFIPESDIINYKDSTKIEPKIDADSGAKYTVLWKSSNNSIVTVDNDGNVYGAKKGSATVTCTVTDSLGNTYSDSCIVKVEYSILQWIIMILLFGWIWY